MNQFFLKTKQKKESLPAALHLFASACILHACNWALGDYVDGPYGLCDSSASNPQLNFAKKTLNFDQLLLSLRNVMTRTALLDPE